MASSSTRDISHYVDTESAALRESLEDLLVAMAQAAKTEGIETRKALGEKAREIISRITSAADELATDAGRAKATVTEGRERLQDIIRTRPLLAVGIAAAAGFLLASLRRR